MFEDLRTHRPGSENRLCGLLIGLRSPGFHAVVAYRFGHWLTKRNLLVKILLFPLYVVFSDIVKVFWGIEIGRRAVIGRRFRILHAGTIVIGDHVEIGDDCVIHQGVTIGATRSSGQQQGLPNIGNGVFIGAGAKVIGQVTIGDGATIGANAVIHKDIPAGSTAVCYPGFKIIEKGRNDGAEEADNKGSG